MFHISMLKTRCEMKQEPDWGKSKTRSRKVNRLKDSLHLKKLGAGGVLSWQPLGPLLKVKLLVGYA